MPLRLRLLGAGLVVTLAAALPALPAPAAPGDGGGDTAYAARPAAGTPGPVARATDPRRTRGLYVDPQMSGARAARQDSTFDPIGSRPQALWISDDSYPQDRVRSVVDAYTAAAVQARKTPLLAVYAIPDRDCGLYSAGGLPGSDAYKAWIAEAAAGMAGRHAMVVLEPDAVPFMGDPRCQNAGDRAALLRWATRRLTRAGAWVYLDAGHSGWRTPAAIAALLKESGIRTARGFSTDVGNFRRTTDEVAYAKAVVAELKKLGVTGTRYVTETARNGAKDPRDGDFCNPVWARLGRAPKLVFASGGSAGPLDGYLWVKHPGESDGQSTDDACHGGPAAGQWWQLGARRLLGLS